MSFHQRKDERWLQKQQRFYLHQHQMVMHLLSDIADAWGASLAQPTLLERLLPIQGRVGRYYKIECDTARLTRTSLIQRDYSEDFLLGFCALYLWVGSPAARPNPEFGADTHCLSKVVEPCAYFRVSMDGESETFHLYDSRGIRQHWDGGEGDASPPIDTLMVLEARLAYAWTHGCFFTVR